MKTTTTNFASLINNGCPYHYVKLYLNDEELQVSFKSFTYYGLINSGESITIGSTCASHVEFELYNQKTSLENKEVQIKVGIDVNGAIENVSLGFFTITKPTNIDEVSKYTAYDRMIKLEKLYVSELSSPTTQNIMNEIGTQTGYGFANNLTTDISIDVNKIKGYTYREIIGYISALYGANCVINDKGQIEFKTYLNTNIVIGTSRIYENGLELTSDSGFSIGYLKCATGKTVENTTTDEEGEESTETEDVILSVGNGSTGISISNPLMTEEILENIYNTYFANFIYQPCKVNILGNVLLECGDIVTIDNGVNTYIMPIMSITHSIDGGVTTNIEAISQTESEQEINYTGPTIKYVERVYSELIEANEILAKKIQASNITTDYLEANYAKINLANIENGCITNAMIGTEAVGTSQIANGSITDAKIVELTANKITAGTLSCDRLLINGSDKSLVYYLNNMGDLTYSEVDTINGGVLTERSITADKIVANAITANEIASRTITANKIVTGAITANEIAANTITSAEIKANSINADRINVTDLFAQDITATGTITGGKINSGTVEACNIIGCNIGINDYLFFNNYSGSVGFRMRCTLTSTSSVSIGVSPAFEMDSISQMIITAPIVRFDSNVDISGNAFVNGNTILDVSNYTSYCAKASHTHSGYASSSHTHSGYLSSGGTLSGALYLGSNSYYINGNGNGVFNKVTTDNFEASGTNFLVNSNGNVRIGGTSAPSSTNAIFTYWKDGSSHNLLERSSDGLTTNLGWAGSSSYATVTKIRGRTCQCVNSSGTSTLSDKNLKKDFLDFTDEHDVFYDNLKPKTYKYKLGSSNRQHFGYVTQEVEDALEVAGMTTQDFAGVNIMPIYMRETEVDKDGNEIDIEDSADNYLLDKGVNEQHNLIYTEFIALNTWQIQKLKIKVEEQQKQIDELRELVNQLINK